jgi:membrane-anchored protein YejM (alkaline phosphatase superfamily)
MSDPITNSLLCSLVSKALTRFLGVLVVGLSIYCSSFVSFDDSIYWRVWLSLNCFLGFILGWNLVINPEK